MALFKNLQLTKDGQNAVNEYVLGTTKTPISLSAIAIGDGEAPANPSAQSALVHEVKRLPIETSTLTKGVLTVTARLSTDSITSDITHREIGLYSGSTLFAYANAGDDYDFIPAAGQNTAVIKRISCKITVGTVGVKLETIDSSDYITYAGALQRLTEMMPTAVETNVSKQLPGAVEKELKKQLPPAVKTSVTEQLPELAPPAMKECAPPIVREVIQGFMDNGQWNEDIHAVVVEALNEDAVATHTTAERTSSVQAKWAHIDKRHSRVGKLDYITLDTTQQPKSTTKYRLMVWEEDEVGGWKFLANSHNEANFETGQPTHFVFRGAELHGRAFRFAIVPTDNKGEWNIDTMISYTLSVAEPEDGDLSGVHDPSNQNQPFLPCFTLGYCAPRCAPYSHMDDAVAHLNKTEHTKLTELLAKPEKQIDEDLYAVSFRAKEIASVPESEGTITCRSKTVEIFPGLHGLFTPERQLEQITLNINTTPTTPTVCLALQEKRGDRWQFRGCSTLATCEAGKSATFRFPAGIILLGSSIRFCFLSAPSDKWPEGDAECVVDLVCCNTPEDNESWIKADDSYEYYEYPKMSVTYDLPPKGEKGDKGDTGSPGADGAPGKDGTPGKNGVTFTPSVADDGTLSWTNDGDLENPQPVNIKGDPGEGGGFDIPYTYDDTNQSFAIGDSSTTGDSRSSIALGDRTTATGAASIALGSTAKASGIYSIAIGDMSKVDGSYSIGIGDYSDARQSNTIAIGSHSLARDIGAAAIGLKATVTSKYSTALGYEANTAEERVLILAAWKSTASRTQLYLVSEGSDLATRCCEGKAALGFTVDDFSGNILKSGWIALEELCKNPDFSPNFAKR